MSRKETRENETSIIVHIYSWRYNLNDTAGWDVFRPRPRRLRILRMYTDELCGAETSISQSKVTGAEE
jgi:hypothetical protein